MAAPAVVVVAQDDSAPTIVKPTTKSARVKGTWTMFFGMNEYDFVDGQRYELPIDLYIYLRTRGNIYDTL